VPGAGILENVDAAQPRVGAVAAHREVGHREVHVDPVHRAEEVLPLLALRRREAGINPSDRRDAARFDRLGVLREDGLNAGMIFTIADRRPLASEVKYAADATANNNWQNRIQSGLFHFGSKFLAITSPNGGSSLATFKRLYDGGSGLVFDPNAPQTTANNGGTKPGVDMMNGVDPGHTPAQVLEATKAFIRVVDWNETQIQRLTNIAIGINKHNYTRARERFEALQSEIVASYTDALDKYKGAIQAKLWNTIESKRNKIRAMQVPSYVQY